VALWKEREVTKQPVQAKHTWEFEADSLLLRFYAAVWGADPQHADFCKLFWAVVLMPVGLFMVVPGRWLAHRFGPHIRRYDARVDAGLREREAQRHRSPREPGRAERFLARVAAFVASPRVRRIAGRILFGVGLIVGVGLVGFFVYVTIVFPLTVLMALAVMLAGVALDTTGAARRAGRFMADGYRSVKSNTCPRIVVRGVAETSEMAP
jgi:hypothetical protein